MTTTTTPVARPEPDIDVICKRLTGDLTAALRAYDEAKWRFKAVTEAYEERHGRGYVAETHAAGDPRRQQAAADCGWWHGEAMLAATALIALRTEQAARREASR